MSAGWTVPAIMAGLLLAVVGGALAHHVGAQAEICSVFDPSGTCARIQLEQTLGIAGLLAGAPVALIGSFFAHRRGKRAIAAGAPWVVHRPLSGALRGLSVGRAAIIGVVLSLIATVCGHSAWSSYSHQRRVAAFRAAQQTFPAVVLPVSLHEGRSISSGCIPSSIERCASSNLTPAQLKPSLTHFFHAHTDGRLRVFAGCPTPQCPLTLVGTVNGYPVLVFVFQRLVDAQKEAVPAGAVPLKPGSTRAFWAGSNVTISLTSPS